MLTPTFAESDKIFLIVRVYPIHMNALNGFVFIIFTSSSTQFILEETNCWEKFIL